MSARDAKNGFGRLIDLARAAPVAIEKYGRPVVVVLAVEEYERLSGKTEKQRSGSPRAKVRGAKT
ncbi:prevent-host-death family protein [Mesorhizobium robiniae]|uniref:Antitoxin n=1 Tax=Mesorhizobium robiniae TaxID=559315 RepID=A0ABV2GL98_9HYPH